MKLGLNLLLAGLVITPEQAPLLGRIKAAGFDGVEVPVIAGAPADYAALGRVLADLGLAATAIGVVTPDANPLSPDPAVRAAACARFDWMLDCTRAVGATMLCGPFHSPVGVFSGAGPTDGELARCADVLAHAAGQAATRGALLSVEPLTRYESYVLNTLDQAAALAARVDHPALGLLFDTYNTNIEEDDSAAALAAHLTRVNHVHLSENHRGIPGRGHVAWGRVFQTLRAGGYDGWLVVEAFSRSAPDVAGLMHLWRDMVPDEAALLAESVALVRRHGI